MHVQFHSELSDSKHEVNISPSGMMPGFIRLLFLLYACRTSASQSSFSVNDDVFAYPQYEIEFPPSYVYDYEAVEKLNDPKYAYNTGINVDSGDEASHYYERMLLHSTPYLCSIPRVQSVENDTTTAPSEDDQKKELVRAADRGWQLLQDMEGKQCLYYSTGWWSYSFCYNSVVKQFHALQPGTHGGRIWPPQEDPTTPSYVLGKYNAKPQDKGLAELQTKAETSYLVQRLEGGTPCDLTGENRKVEVEFHCHPQSTDRIGYIKETATCAYLMVIYTPRLCNDVAFQPPKDSQIHTIICHAILTEEEAVAIDSAPEPTPEVDQRVMIGNIELGGMKEVGQDGKKIQRGKVVMTPEEKADIVIMQKDGQIQGLSKPELKKLNLNPEEIETFKQELQKIAGKKDWKIERLGDENGQIQLRGIVSTEEESEDNENTEAGSEEEYKQEL